MTKNKNKNTRKRKAKEHYITSIKNIFNPIINRYLNVIYVAMFDY